MIDALLDPLGYDFFVRALLAAVVVGTVCAVVGTFVVLRGLAFIGDALAHGVLPGIAGALLLGLPGLAGAFAGAAAMIGGVSLVRRRSRLSGDTAIGLLFVGMLALGVVIVSRSDSFTGDLTRILFGEVLGISWGDIAIQAVATVLVAGVAALCARPFLMLSFDRDQTRVAGLLLSYHADLAAGASIVLVEVAVFFVALTARGLLRPAPAVAT